MINFKGLKVNEKGLIPVVVQEAVTERVLMLAYMNEEAMNKSLETGFAHYYSRSRETLWFKGETSGNLQEIVEMNIDCDKDTLLIKVKQTGVACHTGRLSCFYRSIDKEGRIVEEDGKATETTEEVALASASPSQEEAITGTGIKIATEIENGVENGAIVLQKLYEQIADRKENKVEGSYTNYLFDKGIDKILKKIGEESSEIIIAAKNPSNEELCYEISDLVYHLTVLMVERKIKLEDIYSELKRRRK
jgi:phosphoribosyl-AMP cyclohydrolase / phosphoribosyl-ATP pyrophosphohydrolase